MTVEQKEVYTLQELFDDLPMTISALARQSGINEVTLARMRDGKRTRRDTVNKLLRTLSQVYGLQLNIRNVTGVNVLVNKRVEKREAKQQSGKKEVA